MTEILQTPSRFGTELLIGLYLWRFIWYNVIQHLIGSRKIIWHMKIWTMNHQESDEGDFGTHINFFNHKNLSWLNFHGFYGVLLLQKWTHLIIYKTRSFFSLWLHNPPKKHVQMNLKKNWQSLRIVLVNELKYRFQNIYIYILISCLWKFICLYFKKCEGRRKMCMHMVYES